ncbi:putative odorant receptor 92a [Galleria mellonella]|uniref:Odorant receptor n=1 Tax=Galleria mellonella TaxID=7137 RepID=A0ABM3N3Y5_GALME|nr:putative odorant receptor 92a [Galleria mellonella]
MQQKSREKVLFEKYLRRTNKLLNITGIHLNEKDSNRSLTQRLRHRWFYCINTIWLYTAIIGQIKWFMEAITTNKGITEITYFMPCITLCFIGYFKAYDFVKYAHCVNEVVDNLRKLQNMSLEKQKYRDEVEKEMLNNILRIYNIFTNLHVYTYFLGLLSFSIGPLLTMAVYYYSTGKIIYMLPFFIWYPLDKTKLINWVIIYIHQIWTAVIAVFTVLGSDNFFATCSTFVNIQFYCLHYDIEKIDTGTRNKKGRYVNYVFRGQFKQIIKRHKILIDCVNFMETIYTKSILFNVATSSVIICVTGFNIMIIDHITMMIPFIFFLVAATLQIVVLCYYGDKIMQYSMEISDAVYNSKWYLADAKIMKDLLFLSIRSRRACKITAYQFTDLNLNTFGKIMGRSWSYFALLQTIYGRKN